MVIYQVALRNPPHFRKVPPNFENMFFQVEYLLGFSICLRRLKPSVHIAECQLSQIPAFHRRFIVQTFKLQTEFLLLHILAFMIYKFASRIQEFVGHICS